MRILLPPSETKNTRRRGGRLDLDRLSFPELSDARGQVLEALAATSARPDALEQLEAPAAAADVVAAQAEIDDVPTMPAASLYSGVLYDALDLASLTGTPRRRANRSIRIISAAFGVVTPTDRLPTYRLSMGTSLHGRGLPDNGSLAKHWAQALAEPLATDTRRGPIVDMRSAAYVAAWRPDAAAASRWIAVHVVRDGPDGRTAVSHMAKHTRGLVARALVEADETPRTIPDVVDALRATFSLTLHPAPSSGPRRLDVVEPH